MANAFLSVAETLRPLLPLLTTMASIKISKGLFDFGTGFIGGLRKGGGAGAVGDTLGGAVTGGTGKDPAATAAQQALTTSLNKHATVLSQNNTALRNLDTKLSSTTTQLTGAIGNLISALNLSGLGGGSPRKFAKGGPVRGPSHSQGGVPAILEGGEYVIPKGHAKGGRIRVGLTKQDYAGMFLQPSGPDTVPGPQTTYTGSLREAGKIASMINSGHKPGKSRTRRQGGKHSEHLGMSGGKDPARGLLDPLTDATGDIVFGNTSKTIGIGKSTFLRSARRAGIFSGPEVNTLRGKGVGVKWTDLSSSQKKRSKTVIAQLGGTLQPGKGFEGVTAAEVGSANLPLVGWPGIFAIENAHETAFKDRLRKHWHAMLDETAGTPLKGTFKDMIFERAGGKAVEGHGFEAMLLAFSQQGGFSKDSDEDFDMRGGMGSKSKFAGKVSKLFDPKDLLTQFKWLDAKRSQSSSTKASLVKKGANTAAMDPSSGIRLVYEEGGRKTLLRAAGGNVFSPRGTDTVPAMLTPGEFVINKGSAKKIGYGNLGRMNRMKDG